MFSLLQHWVRQDAIRYALAVACRADHAWKLITWPHIAKDAAASENTGFLHLDLIYSQLRCVGAGGDMISSPLSLDGKNAQGCTTVVPGFQHHIKEWNERTLQRGALTKACPPMRAVYTRQPIARNRATPNQKCRRQTLCLVNVLCVHLAHLHSLNNLRIYGFEFE